MSDQVTDGDGLEVFAADVAAHVATYLAGVTEVAAGAEPDTTVSALLVLLAEVSMAGAMLGAVADVVPTARFEPDTGPDPDMDRLRESLATLLEGLDDYATVFDPLLPGRPHAGRVSDDLATVAVDVDHGLRHYRAGRVSEALFWWQFSYLSNWGARALAAQQALLSVATHGRLDSDEAAVSAAQADALLRD